MTRWTLGFLVGVIGITNISHLPSVKIAYLLITISIILIILIFFRIFSSSWILFFVACCLGFSFTLMNAHQRLSHQLLKILEGETLVAKGRIVTIPELHANSVRFDFLINALETSFPIQYPLRVRTMRQESIAKAMRVEEPTIGVR
jgi:predicted membrane metal-binding protein